LELHVCVRKKTRKIKISASQLITTMICMYYDHNKKFGLLKFNLGYGKFNLNSPKGYSLKIINAQTDINLLFISFFISILNPMFCLITIWPIPNFSGMKSSMASFTCSRLYLRQGFLQMMFSSWLFWFNLVGSDTSAMLCVSD